MLPKETGKFYKIALKYVFLNCLFCSFFYNFLSFTTALLLYLMCINFMFPPYSSLFLCLYPGPTYHFAPGPLNINPATGCHHTKFSFLGFVSPALKILKATYQYKGMHLKYMVQSN
jgi:hypothetical protein